MWSPIFRTVKVNGDVSSWCTTVLPMWKTRSTGNERSGNAAERYALQSLITIHFVHSLVCAVFSIKSINQNFDSDLQGSRRCRAKVITDIVNGRTAIVAVKGTHNHEVFIKRNKNHTLIDRRRCDVQDREMFRIGKVQRLTGAPSGCQYDNLVYVEEDDESIVV